MHQRAWRYCCCCCWVQAHGPVDMQVRWIGEGTCHPTYEEQEADVAVAVDEHAHADPVEMSRADNLQVLHHRVIALNSR